MVGGTTSGNCETGSRVMATMPMMRMTTDSEIAKIGRSMKKCPSFMSPLLSLY